jgi:hypothetical protein
MNRVADVNSVLYSHKHQASLHSGWELGDVNVLLQANRGSENSLDSESPIFGHLWAPAADAEKVIGLNEGKAFNWLDRKVREGALALWMESAEKCLQ